MEGSARERGSAPAEFAMVAALLLLVFLMVLQVGFAVHVKHVAISHAIEGARTAARSGSSLDAGVARTRALLTSSLSSAYAERVSARYSTEGGLRTVVVEATVPVPVVALWGAGDMTVRGRAYAEQT